MADVFHIKAILEAQTTKWGVMGNNLKLVLKPVSVQEQTIESIEMNSDIIINIMEKIMDERKNSYYWTHWKYNYGPS